MVLDDARRLARVFRIDDHLHVGEIGDGVERRVQQRIDPRRNQEQGGQDDQELVVDRPLDDLCEHKRLVLADLCRLRFRGARRSLVHTLAQQLADGRLQIAFRIDQELR